MHKIYISVLLNLSIFFLTTKLYSQCGTINNLPDTAYLSSIGQYSPNPTVTVSPGYITFDTIWNSNPFINNTNIINPIINSGGSYYLNVQTQDTTNLVVNGNFSAGTTSWTTMYNTATGGTWGPLSTASQYMITTNPNLAHSNFAFFGDHTTGSGNMLVVNGSTIPNTSLWCQTITVVPNTNYVFTYYVRLCVSSNPPQLFIQINGVNVGTTFTPTVNTTTWQKVTVSWNSGINTTAAICLYDANIQDSGNDFAIDDLSLNSFCTISDTVHVIQSNFTYSLIPSCIKDTFSFSATNALAYDSIVWHFGDGSIGYGQNVFHYYNSDNNYTVTMTIYHQGQIITYTKNLTYIQTNTKPGIIVNISNNKCFGEKKGALAITVLNTANPFYTQINSGGWQTNKSNYSGLEAGTYYIQVKNSVGCEADTTVTITQPTKLDLNLQLTDVTCYDGKNGTASFNISGGTKPYNYQFGSGTSINNTYFTGLFPGTYAFHVSDSNYCKLDTIFTITQPNKLTFEIDSVINPICFQKNTGSFIINTSGGTPAYTYYVDGNSQSSPNVNNAKENIYHILVKDANNCADSMYFNLEKLCCTPLVSNAFTPNGDNLNDFFTVINKSDFNYLELHIFNRWGQEIFSALDDKAVWDGTYKGKTVDQGVYYYNIYVKCNGSSYIKTLFKGDITLLK